MNTTIPSLPLNNGIAIPQFGFGVFQIDPAETEEACLEAFRLGYRHIDTAHAYQNERGVGAALRKSGLKRDEVWITSKLWPSEYGEEASAAGIDAMLARLGTDRIDLLLLHQQVGDFLGAWRAMEAALAAGKVRSIGISNFDGERLDALLDAAAVKPAAFQVECHPYYQQRALKERIATFGGVLESWYPIGHGDPALLGEPVLAEIAARTGKTPAQVVLRWHVQEGNVVFPKSTNPKHIAENLDIFDFALTDADMAAIRALDRGKRYYTATYEEQLAFLHWKPAD